MFVIKFYSELAEDEVIVDPNHPWYPDPYPAMDDWEAVGATEAATTGLDSSEYVPMEPGTELDEDDYESMEVRGTPENSWKQPGLPSSRPGRSLSESDVSERDRHYDVLWQATTGSRDDSSVQPGRKGKKVPPAVPSRLDIIGENSETLAGEATSDVSEKATGRSPKGSIPKKRPIPTPRRKRMQKPRPTSDGFLEPSSSRDDAEAIRRCNSDCSVEKVPPEFSLPYKTTEKVTDSISDKGGPATALNSASEHSEKHYGEKSTAGGNQLTPEGRLVQKSQTDFAANSGRDTSSDIPHGASAVSQVVSGHERSSETNTPSPVVELPGHSQFDGQPANVLSSDNSSVDLIEFSTDQDSCPPLPPKKQAPAPHPGKPRYAKPTSLPLYPEIPPEVINQPPPPPEDLFGDHSSVPGFHSTQTNSLHYGITPIFDHHGGLIASRLPLRFDALSINLPVEGSYGEEIDAGIRKIQDVCGEDVSRDWCYAALLQYQGDVEEVVRVIKVQKLVNITAKTEEFCKRTLTHCNWDLNRAVSYIVDHFGDRDV